MKKFQEYLEKGVIKKQYPDKARAEDLIRETDRKFSCLNKIIKKIGVNDENANDLIESCFDIVIGLSRAKMLFRGFGSSGKGAHEAEVAFLEELKFTEAEIEFIDKLRYFRNGILYYGKQFNKEYAQKVIEFMGKIRKRLNKQKI